MNRFTNRLEIVVFKASNGMGWFYAPSDLLAAEPQLFRYPDERGFATVAEALNAVVLDKSIPKRTPVSVEGASGADMADCGLPFLARAKEAFDQLQAECHAMTAGPGACCCGDEVKS